MLTGRDGVRYYLLEGKQLVDNMNQIMKHSRREVDSIPGTLHSML